MMNRLRIVGWLGWVLVWLVMCILAVIFWHALSYAGPIVGNIPSGLRHATDCINGGVIGQLGQQCTDLDDGKLWTCKTPAAGGVTTVCDVAGDWLATGFSVTGGGITSINSATGTTQTIGGTAPVAVSTNTGSNTTTVALTGQVPGTQVSNVPAGGIAAITTQAAIDELETEKASAATLTTHTADTAAHSATAANTASRIVTRDASGNFSAGTISAALTGTATTASALAFNGTNAGSGLAIRGVDTEGNFEDAFDVATQAEFNATIATLQPLDAELTTLAGKTVAGTGSDIRLSTGAFAANDCVKVDASGNFATAGAACGSGGGGGSQSFQDVVTVGKDVTSAVSLATAPCIGDGTYKTCWYGNASEGPVTTALPAGNMTWKLSTGFDLNINANDGTNIVNVDETTRAVSIPNTLTVGTLFAPGVVKQFVSTVAPTPSDDDTEGFAVHSEWIETTSNPDVIYICTNASTGAAVWVPITTFVQVEKSLNDAFNVGKNITGANSQANAQCTGDGTGQKCGWYDSVTGWHEEVTPSQHYSVDIPATFAYILRYDGTEIVRWDSTGQQKFANAGKPSIAIPWSAAGVETDGTNCETQAQSTINSGVRAQDFGCVAFTTGAGNFYGLVEMRGAWSPSDPMPFTLRLRTIGTTTKTWTAEVALWCFGEGEAFPSNTNFDAATEQTLSITTGTTANVRRSATTAAITPGGTCVAGDSVAFRVQTRTGHDALPANAKVLGGSIGAKYLQLGD